MVKRILFATDLGLYGPYLMKRVAELASSTGAVVDVLHVVEPMGVFAESIINTYVPEKERQYLREQGMEEVLERIRLQVLDAIKADYDSSGFTIDDVVVEQGSAASTIIAQAQLRQADLIALGSHGQQAYRGGLIGSVVAKVLQMSPIPVYMVPMVSLSDLGRKHD